MEGQQPERSSRDGSAVDTLDRVSSSDLGDRRSTVVDDTDMQTGEQVVRESTATVTSIRRRADGSRPAMTDEESRVAGLDADRADPADTVSSGDILTLLREYLAIESTSRRGGRRDTSMGETDLAAMRLLVQADTEGRRLTPGSLATSLGISTASTTALVDRLSTAGFVKREPHATDRRSTVIVPTVSSESEVREVLDRGRASFARVTEDMSQHEIDVVARFLSNMIAAVRDDPNVGH